MPDYQESQITGSRWKRACRNPLNGTPSVLFAEEEVINLGEGQEPIRQLVSNLSVPFSLSDTFPIRNPETGEVIEGQIGTQAQLYALMVSAYWHYALARDAAAQVIE
jgi:hypothetical protein